MKSKRVSGIGVGEVAGKLRGRRDRRRLRHPPAVHDVEPVTLLEAGDHRAWRGRAADEHPLHLREIPAPGIRVEQLEDPEPDRRHPGRPGHPLGDERVEQALRVEERARVDELGTEHRREVRVAPGVRVEHRHDREDHVALRDAEAHRVAGCDAERVQHRRAVRIEHALRQPGRPARVAHRRGLVLVQLRVLPRIGVDSRQQLLVAVLDDQDVFDVRALSELVEQRDEAAVDDDRAIVRMRRDVREVVRVQPQVERVQHEATARDAQVGLVVDEVIPAERPDAVAALEPELLQADRQGASAAARLAVGAPLEAAVGQTRHDLRAGRVRLGPPEQRRQRQLVVHHQSVHRVSPCRFARSSGPTSCPSRSM